MENSNPDFRKIIDEIEKGIISLDKALEGKKREDFELIRKKVIKNFDELGEQIK
jgi:hypothetical protein